MLNRKKLRVLVVDDTIVYRKAVSDIIVSMPNVELVGVAQNGKIALAKILSLKPDIVTLDIEMPEMNGLQLLAELRRKNIDIGTVMLSTLTSEGGAMTLKALELGAFDFILKPMTSTSLEAGKKEIRSRLEPILKAFAKSLDSKSRRDPKFRSNTSASYIKQPANLLMAASRKTSPFAEPKTVLRRSKSEIVTIGISTGGPHALNQMLPELPGDLGVPILIVQHMPPVFTRSLADSLDNKCALTVKEAENNEPLCPNVVYIAPGGKQMKLAAGAGSRDKRICITEDPPENSCRPSADYLFRSVADIFMDKTTAVIMTGMGSDGTKGLQYLKSKSAFIVAQDENTCVVYGMPRTPAELGYVDIVVPLHQIAEEIIKTIR